MRKARSKRRGMIVAGLTGSIGMGKSTAARMLAQAGIPVHSSDAAVHMLLAPGGAAYPLVAAAFPGTADGKGGPIDRQELGRLIFADAASRARLESILHPLVREEQQKFLRRARRLGCRLAVLDIPLLFETGTERRLDAVICVSAPAFIQAQRVLARPGMTREKFHGILSSQMPDREKRKRADFIVPTGLGLAPTRRILLEIIDNL